MTVVSIVIPVFNEAGNIGPLVRETFATVPGDVLGEVVVVDDASTDGSVAEVTALLSGYPGLRLLRHPANMGKSAAVRTGVRAARHGVIVTIDGDGQNPPAEIARLVAAFSPQGPHLVGGVRQKRNDGTAKKYGSRLANGLRRWMLRDDCPDTACGFKVFERERYLLVPFFHNQNRYLPALFKAQGCQAVFLPVDDRPRVHGQSKFTNLGRAIEGVWDLLGVSWLIRRSRPLVLPDEVAR
jgi:dolichol-phosphate mannosyltransferase